MKSTILITIFLASAICSQAQSNTDRIIILERWKTAATKQLKTDSINIAWLKAQKKLDSIKIKTAGTDIVMLKNDIANLKNINKADSLKRIADSLEIKKIKDYIYGTTATATLEGSAIDLDGYIVSYKWRKIAGPFEGIIVSPDSAITKVTNLHPGTYEYELTATDDRGASDRDSVLININYPTIGNYAYFKRQ